MGICTCIHYHFRSIQALLVFVSIQEQGGKICINSLTNWLFNYIILGVNGVSSSLLSLYKKANSSLKVIKCDCLYPGWLVWTEAGVGFCKNEGKHFHTLRMIYYMDFNNNNSYHSRIPEVFSQDFYVIIIHSNKLLNCWKVTLMFWMGKKESRF